MIKIPGGSDKLISVNIEGYEPPHTSDGGYLVTTSAVTLEIETTDRLYKQIIIIPRGFKWDGASIPAIFRAVIGRPTDSEFQLASLIHDFLYSHLYNRHITDDVFYYLLDRNEAVPGWKLRLMFWAVRTGGFVIYASNTSKFWRFVRGFFN